MRPAEADRARPHSTVLRPLGELAGGGRHSATRQSQFDRIELDAVMAGGGKHRPDAWPDPVEFGPVAVHAFSGRLTDGPRRRRFVVRDRGRADRDQFRFCVQRKVHHCGSSSRHTPKPFLSLPPLRRLSGDPDPPAGTIAKRRGGRGPAGGRPTVWADSLASCGSPVSMTRQSFGFRMFFRAVFALWSVSAMPAPCFLTSEVRAALASGFLSLSETEAFDRLEDPKKIGSH